jgi:membrane-associated phospholipid phosphatase
MTPDPATRRFDNWGIFIVFALAGVLFAGLAANVAAGGWLVQLDSRVAGWVQPRTLPGLTQMVVAFTHLHAPWVVTGYVVLAVAFLAWRGHWHWLAGLVAVLPSGMVLNWLLKQVFQRPRPEQALLVLDSYSFPSGHAMCSTLLYGLLAAALLSRTRQAPARAAIMLGAAALAALASMSRVYLGVHYLSDVLAGMALATAWLALCLLVSRRRRRDVP